MKAEKELRKPVEEPKLSTVRDDELADLLNSLPLPLKADKRKDKHLFSIFYLAGYNNEKFLNSLENKSPLDLTEIAISFLQDKIQNPEQLAKDKKEAKYQHRFRIAIILKSLGYTRAFAQVLTNEERTLTLRADFSNKDHYLMALDSENRFQIEIIFYQSKLLRKAIIANRALLPLLETPSISELPEANKRINDDKPLDLLSILIDTFMSIDSSLNFLEIQDEEELGEYRFRIAELLLHAGLLNVCFQIIYNKLLISKKEQEYLLIIANRLEISKATEQYITKQSNLIQQEIETKLKILEATKILKKFFVKLFSMGAK